MIPYKIENGVLDVLFATLGAPTFTKQDNILGMSVWGGIYSMELIRKYAIRFPSERQYICKDLLYLSYDRFYFKILNVISRLINRSDFISYMQKLSKANVYITGSDFIEKDNWNEGRLVDNFWNKKLFVLGINFGPFRTKEFLDYYRNLFSKTSNVCVRDKVSLEYFKDLPIVHYAPDVVFNLKYKSVKNPNDVVLISVIDPTKDNLINVKVKDSNFPHPNTK